MNHDLLNAFKTLSTWQDRYKALVELSKTLDPFPVELKIDEHRVIGCENDVWIAVAPNQNRLIFESQSKIVKGIIALMFLYIKQTDKTKKNKMEMLTFLTEYHIFSDLSESKQYGMNKIIDRVIELSTI